MKSLKLSDIFELQMGKTPNRKEVDRYWRNGKNYWVSIADITNSSKYITYTKEKITDNAVDETGIKLINKNTIIMSFKLSVGKTAITTMPLYTNEAIIAFIDKGLYDIDINYMYYLFSNKDWSLQANKAVKGITLNKSQLSQVKIKIPDINCQKMISEKLDIIENIIQKREEQLVNFDNIIRSRFIDMFENKQRKELYKFAEITMGQSPLSEYYNYNGLGFPFYQGKVEFGDVFVRKTKTWCTKPTKFAKPNDILISVRAPVGSVNIAFEECCIGRGLASITPIENKLESLYLFYALKIKENEISKLGVGSTFKAINKQQVLDLLIPDAEIDEQRNFADFVKSIDKSKLAVKKSLEELEILKKSLMQKYFG